jgi:type I restriction enzyme S subunit
VKSSILELPLTEVLSAIVDNRGRSCPTAQSGFPLIATNCIQKDHRYPVFEKVRYISQDIRDNWFRNHPEPGDIVFVCKGAPGRVAVVPGPVPFAIAQDMVALRADPSIVDATYLYYVLKSELTQAKIANLHVGTMIPHFKKGDFNKLRLSIHEDLDEQRRIAEVLGALDDLIDTNNRTISQLGELADELFREAEIDGEWKTFADVVNVSGGGTPSTSNDTFWNGDVPWATPTDLTALRSPYLFGTAKMITDVGLRACSSRLNPVGSVLMTSRATIGRIAVAQVPVATNQGFIVLHPRHSVDGAFLFHELRNRVDEFISRANGSTFLEISRGTFKTLKVKWPTAEERRKLSARLSPFHEAAVFLERENGQLRHTRDELLPLLMSGKVRVRPVGVSV